MYTFIYIIKKKKFIYETKSHIVDTQNVYSINCKKLTEVAKIINRRARTSTRNHRIGSTRVHKYFHVDSLLTASFISERDSLFSMVLIVRAKLDPTSATVIRFKLLIERVEGVCSRLNLECWTNIHDEINLHRTD